MIKLAIEDSMPVYSEKRRIKLRCKKCGEEFTITAGGYGDCPTSINELARLARDILRAKEGPKCPKCSSREVEIEG